MNIVSKMKQFLLLLPMVAGMALTQSCTENIDTSARYTFTGYTIISYLESHEAYSEYCALLDTVNISDFSDSKVSQLLSARGQYTCFAPTNEAIQNYLIHLADSGLISEPTWDAPEFKAVDPETGKCELLELVRKTIVHNSLINNGDNIEAYQTGDISEKAIDKAMLSLPNMMNRKLQVTEGNGTKYAVGGANISDTECNIYTINGRIHQVDKVIAPSTQTAGDWFQKNLDDRKQNNARSRNGEEVQEQGFRFYTLSSLIIACGLKDTLNQAEDELYYQKLMKGDLPDLPQHPTFKGNGGPTPRSPGVMPERRYIGFTIFAEDDAWWEKALGLEEGSITGIEPEELVDMVNDFVIANNYHLSSATTDRNYTNANNALHQFVTYHMLPAKIEYGKLVIHFNELWYNLTDMIKKASVFDFYTTMGKRRLLKTYEASQTCDGKRNVIYLNRFPNLSNGRDGDYTELGCDPEKQGIAILTDNVPELYNTYIYRIEDCLYYNDQVAETFGKERIRIDVSTFFKELMTNDIRANENFEYNHQAKGMPQSNKYNYLEDCEISENTNFYYLTGRVSKTATWTNYQGDELNVVGNYEMTMKLPPVPKDGVYELRMGLSANNMRGMCQVYWGTNKDALPAAGIPFDMRMGGKALK
nr:fasciclin domain-containing protein [Bacteroidaceae bacterium]